MPRDGLLESGVERPRPGVGAARYVHAGGRPQAQVLLPSRRVGLDLVRGHRMEQRRRLIASHAHGVVLVQRLPHVLRKQEAVGHRRLLAVYHQRLAVKLPRLLGAQNGISNVRACYQFSSPLLPATSIPSPLTERVKVRIVGTLARVFTTIPTCPWIENGPSSQTPLSPKNRVSPAPASGL